MSNVNPEPPASAPAVSSHAITVTWAATSKVPSERVRISKAWTPEGKWPVTDGVQRLKYFLERVDYPNLDALAADIERRIGEGTWTMVTGVPRPDLDLTKLHGRRGENFIDAATTLFVTDFDGMTPDKGRDLSKPEHFGQPIVDALRKQLKVTGLHSLSKAKLVLVTTASTGMKLNSNGEPAHKCARFRAIFEFDRPLSLKRQKRLVEKMGELPGFAKLDATGKVMEEPCIDTQVKTHAYNIFVVRALLPKGQADPIQHPVLIFAGDDGGDKVDVAMLAKELGFPGLAEDTAPAAPAEPVDGGSGLPGPKTPDEADKRLLDAPPERRVSIVRKVVAAIPNTLDREEWVGFAHAIDGALDGDPEGKVIFLDFTKKLKGGSDPVEDERMWDTLGGEGKAGFGYLARLLEAQEALTPDDPAVVEARIALRQGRAAACFTPVEAGAGSPEDEESEDDDLLAQRMPTIGPKAFYGVLGPLVETATKRSEATKVGVALQTMTHVGAAMRPFYKPLGDVRVPFNGYNLQLGFSATGRKGTSSAPADKHFPPALARLGRAVEAQLAFKDTNGLARQDAEIVVTEACRKLDWTRSVCALMAAEIEVEIDGLRNEGAETAHEIAVHRTGLRKTKSSRAIKELKQAIAEAEAKNAGLNARIGEAEARLAEVRAVLADQSVAVVEAEKAHAAAVKALAVLPPPSAPPEPWLEIFASVARGPIMLGGINTGEGLVEQIRDPGVKPGRYGPVEDPGVDNKMLFLNMEELGGVLAACTRHGATLSTVLRTAFDCKPLDLPNKTSPSRCAEPYVSLSAGVTPAEFIGKLFDKNDTAYSADNGLGNRFFCAWVMRDRLEPDTQPTPGLDAMMDEIAANIFKVYQTLKPASPFLSTPIDFSLQAQAAWADWYVRTQTTAAASAKADKLLKRNPMHLWKIAGVLAAMNGEHEISLGAFEAALAWAEYGQATIDAIASTALERKKMRILTDDGTRVLEAAKALGADQGWVSARSIRRKTPFDPGRFDKAVASLLRMGPSPITLDKEEYTAGNGVKNTRAVIRINTISAEPTTSVGDIPF